MFPIVFWFDRFRLLHKEHNWMRIVSYGPSVNAMLFTENSGTHLHCNILSELLGKIKGKILKLLKSLDHIKQS